MKTPNTMSIDIYVYLFNQRIFNTKVLPAYRQFMDKDDPKPLIALLKEAIQRLDKGEKISDSLFLNKEILEEAIGILEGTVYYNSSGNYKPDNPSKVTTMADKRIFVEGQCIQDLMLFFCVPRDRGITPEEQLTGSQLGNYLTEHSKWFDEFFMFSHPVRGGRLKPMIGEDSEFFTKEDIQNLSEELAKVPMPTGNPELTREYENLSVLVQLALKDPDLTLVLSQS